MLERLSGSLCDAVTGRPGGQELLEQVERAGLFLVPLDEVRGWWRYHQLFADLLRARMQHDNRPGRTSAPYRGGLVRQQGLADDAIQHALAAGDQAWAARLIEQDFDMVYNVRGEGATIQRWISALPDDLVGLAPAAAGAGADGDQRRHDAAEPLSTRPNERPGRGGRAVRAHRRRAASLLVNVPRVIAVERSYLAQLRGDAEGTAAFAAQALPRSARASGCWTGRSMATGHSRVARGRLAEAERALADGIAGWHAADCRCGRIGRV